MSNPAEIYAKIRRSTEGLHQAGTFSQRALDAIVEHAGRRTIRHSMETGSGVSTLLFSHLSAHHTVFAIDDGNGSIANVRQSDLLRKDNVVFVEGPTQMTLPRHDFAEKLQLALIDGPHGYPFPDLEYYFVYPHLEQGALLILDDIDIRNIYNLFEFLKADKMFRLDAVVRTTAFFTRTDVPTFNPFADGWWDQEYNRTPALPFMLRHTAKRILPRSLVRLLKKG